MSEHNILMNKIKKKNKIVTEQLRMLTQVCAAK